MAAREIVVIGAVPITVTGGRLNSGPGRGQVAVVRCRASPAPRECGSSVGLSNPVVWRCT
jgi:hypothetical protein